MDRQQVLRRGWRALHGRHRARVQDERRDMDRRAVLRSLVVVALLVACKDDKPHVWRKTFIDGTEAACKRSGLEWNGSQCGVPVWATCAAGTESGCKDGGGLWTGTACCTRRQWCVDGTADACKQATGQWTGTLCCMNSSACVRGTDDGCKQMGAKWTGKLCCMTGNATCAEGTGVACKQIGASWTGAQCCIQHASIEGSLRCPAGTEVACKQIDNAKWTGASCCTSGWGPCSEGTDAACTSRSATRRGPARRAA